MARHTARNARLLGGTVLLCCLGVAAAVGASALGKYRWVAPATIVESYSGAPQDKDKSDWVRVNKTMTDKPEDRVYGIRGITWYGYDGCGIKVLPALLHPSADAAVRNDRFGCTEASKPSKTVQLPAGYVLTGLQICDNGQTGWGKDLKGIRVWGHKLDSNGRPTEPTGPVEEKRTGCEKWHQKIACPAGKIVTSIDTYAPNNTAMRLRCASVDAE